MEAEKSVVYVHTNNFPSLLESLGASLVVTTYQAQRVLVFSSGGEKLKMLMRVFPRPTGLSISKSKMALWSKHQLLIFDRVYNIHDLEGKKEGYDFCFSPRLSYISGDLLGHEVALLNDIPHVVNTRFNCISTPSLDCSFRYVWKPKFISALVPEDRCHLNGFAIENDAIHYVTCIARTDVKDAWRGYKQDGGVILDYPSSEVVSSGISMPHSPRIYQDKLFVLNSGRGMLEVVERRTGKRTSIVLMPGFLRGMDFAGQYAFIGLSKIREKTTFGGLEIEEKAKELECAIYCIDLQKGALAGYIKFTKGVEELFEVKVLHGSTNPHIIGFEEDTIDGLFVLPEDKEIRALRS